MTWLIHIALILSGLCVYVALAIRGARFIDDHKRKSCIPDHRHVDVTT